MNFSIENELQSLLGQLDDFQHQREHHYYFVKESFLHGEYLINPKLIASRLLSYCFQEEQTCCTTD